MSTPIVIVSDIHGCWFTLVRLLNQCPSGTKLVLNGDLIDRGPHSRKVVEFAMNNNILTVCGNHEDLLLAFYHRRAHCAKYYDQGVWLHNGGWDTLGNWGTEDDVRGGRVPDEILSWMEGLPAYLTPSEEVDGAGRKLLVSHTGYGLDVNLKGRDVWFRALWGRRRHGDGPWSFTHQDDKGNEIEDGWFRVYGHTQEKEPNIGPAHAMIDTGAAYWKRGLGTLTAFLWPSKEVFSVSYDETPCEPTWTVQNGCIIQGSPTQVTTTLCPPLTTTPLSLSPPTQP